MVMEEATREAWDFEVFSCASGLGVCGLVEVKVRGIDANHVTIE